MSLGQLGAFSDHDQIGGDFPLDSVEDIDHPGNVLHRSEVARVQDDFPPRRDERTAARALASGGELSRVDEVRDHLDRIANRERIEGLLSEPSGDGRHAVARLDGELDRGVKSGLDADQRDVGAVKRGDRTQRSASQHLPGQKRACRVRDGVVRVDQVEMVEFGDLDELRRETERIGRVVEDRVVVREDLM